MTVAELRKALEGLSDDVSVALYYDGRLWRAESITPQKGWHYCDWLDKPSKKQDNEPLVVLS